MGLQFQSRNQVDKESRKLRDNLEQSLKEKLFEKIAGNGPVTTDLFASWVNCKVNQYYSYDPELAEAIGIDAFSYCWSNETFYAFPPFAISK